MTMRPSPGLGRYRQWLAALLTLTAIAAPMASPPPADSPYAGQEVRDLKALSPQEVEGLLAGRGLGYAKVAELNRYPGPAHVLELASQLQLTDPQLQATRTLHARMEARAKALGAELVAAELALERLFRAGTVDEPGLNAALSTIGRLQAELRGVHLQAHLAQRAMLTAEQTQLYVHLRGYGGGPHGDPRGGHHGGHDGGHGHGHRH